MLYLARKSKEEKMEACYNLFQQANWNLTKFYNDTDLFIEDTRKNAREYIENILKLKLTKEQIWCLMPTNIRILFNSYDKIIEQMLNDGVVEVKQLANIDWDIDNLRESISKFCFDICEKYKWINIKIDDYCDKFDISSQTLKNLAREYSFDVLKWDEEIREKEQKKKLSYRKDYNFSNINENTGIFANLFLKILNTSDEEEIIKIFSEFNKNVASIKHGLTNFVASYNLSSEIRDDLFRKFEIYKKYLLSSRKQIKDEQKEQANNELLKQAEEIIIGYINSGCSTTEEYCTNLKLHKKMFEKYLTIIKENNDVLYNDFVKYEEQKEKKTYNELLSNSLIVIDLLKNGVVENGVKREFDLIDYYKYLPIGFDRMLRIIRDDLNLDDYKLLSTYVKEIKNEDELSEVAINNIYNTKTIVGVKIDEENNIIPGTGREITKEEKQNIINYLKEVNIPITNKTYNAAYKKWLSGILIIESEEKDKKK